MLKYKNIKVKFNLEERKEAIDQIIPLLRCKEKFAQYGITISDFNYDILISHHKKALSVKKPTIILERADSCIVHNECVREMAEEKNVLGIFKTSICDPKKINNCGTDRYHFELIKNAFKLNDSLVFTNSMSEKALNKIKCMVPLCCQELFNEVRRQKINYKQERKIDVNYLCNMWQDSPVIFCHRKSISQKLEQLNCSKLVNKILKRKDWINSLLNSKICISPWGWGEMCYRDFDAIYCGAILLKPNSDHVVSLPNIFKNNYYVPFNVDCSDLMNKIYYILNNWKNLEFMRVQARNKILSSWNENWLAEIWAKEIIESYNQYLQKN